MATDGNDDGDDDHDNAAKGDGVQNAYSRTQQHLFSATPVSSNTCFQLSAELAIWLLYQYDKSLHI